MKITDIKATVLTHHYEKPLRFAMMEMPLRSIVVIQVFTDEGVVGIGDADALPTGDPAVAEIITQQLKPFLLGENPLMTDALWEKMFRKVRRMGRRGLEIYAISGIDVALWDIKGKVAGLPIYQLMGGTRTGITAYASHDYLEPSELEGPLRVSMDQGFKAAKIRAGVRPEQDEAIVLTATSLVQGKMGIMVDVNSGWDRTDCFQRARRLDQYGLIWIEEPLPPDDLEGHAALAAMLDTPLALGEHHFTRFEFKAIIQHKAADILQPDIRQGGLTELKRIADLAHTWDLPLVPHSFCSAIRDAATLQLLCAIPNARFLEYNIRPDPLRTDLVREPYLPQNGYVEVGNRPGLGIELDEKMMQRLAA